MIFRKSLSSIKHYVFNLLCDLSPLQKKIVFSNFAGKGYGDNPKYIAEECIKQGLDYDLVWLVSDLDEPFPRGIRKVLYNSYKAKYEIATAKFIINNIKNGPLFKKKTKQYYIQTWHGDFPLKFIEHEAIETLPREYIEKSIRDSSITDLMLAGSKFMADIMQNNFWYNGSIMRRGIPRNDVFFNRNQNDIKQIKKSLGLDTYCKYLLYAPTFRDDYNIDGYNIDIQKVLDTLNNTTHSQWKCIIRLHPNVKNQSVIFNYNNNIINGSDFCDPQDIEFISDLLITDYSSIMIDFGIMGKPVLLYVSDLEKYTKSCRDLRPIFYKLPFQKCNNNEELCEEIRSFNMNQYSSKLKKFLDSYYESYNDGHAAESVVEWIKERMEK